MKQYSIETLSGLDAACLYMETANAPMHTAGLHILEGSLDFEVFRDLLHSRIHLVRSFRQRLVTVPLSIDRPYWVDDPNFNIDWHLHHTALPKPGGWRQLRQLCSRVVSQPLDRSRPLWELTFIEGLDAIPQVPPGSVAIISKIHHAAIDGMSGANIHSLLYDLSLEPRQFPPPEPAHSQALPGDLELMAYSLYNFATRPFKLPGILWETAKATVRTGQLARAARENVPPLPFNAPPTRLNVPISADRIWNTALLSLDRIKRLKTVAGCTVNDIILGICAGALRRYLLEKDSLPDQPLVTAIPVSTRSKSETHTLGNQVSHMVVELATDIADPVKRLEAIVDNTVRGKAYQDAVNAKALVEYSEFVPFGLAGLAARLYSRAELSRRHRPAFNCVITNVPGPQAPLYLNGHRLLAHMGMAPILDGVGLVMTVFSYNGVVSISPVSCPKVMPDLDRFTRYLRESANELEEAILALEAAKMLARQEQVEHTVASVFQSLQRYLEAHPDLPLPACGVYQCEVTGAHAQQWVFDLGHTPPRIYEGRSAEAVCSLRMAEADFVALASGKLDGIAAFMQGKLKVAGDTNEAIRFGNVLAAFPKPTVSFDA